MSRYSECDFFLVNSSSISKQHSTSSWISISPRLMKLLCIFSSKLVKVNSDQTANFTFNLIFMNSANFSNFTKNSLRKSVTFKWSSFVSSEFEKKWWPQKDFKKADAGYFWFFTLSSKWFNRKFQRRIGNHGLTQFYKEYDPE